jgi:acetoacetyl-CoA reductase
MKKMLISGGIGGIRTAITLEFIRNGHHVFSTHNNKSGEALCDWNTVNQVSDENITLLDCDLTKLEQVESIVGSIVQEHFESIVGSIVQEHSIDVLINNAGITDDSSFFKIKFEQWFSALHANLLKLSSLTHIIAKRVLLERQGWLEI